MSRRRPNKRDQIRVAVLAVGAALVLGLLFWAMLGSWWQGLLLGAAFGAAFFFVVVVQARQAAKTLKKGRR